MTTITSAVGTRPVHWTARFGGLRRRCSRNDSRRTVADFDTNPRTGRLYGECRDCRARSARRNADPTLNNLKAGRFDTPALRAAVTAFITPKLADGRSPCPLCRLRPAEVADHRPITYTERGEQAPGMLRSYLCRSCKATLARYESRPHKFSPADPAKPLALAGDVPGALRMTGQALLDADPSAPVIRRLVDPKSIGPFDKTATGYFRAAQYVEYPPLCALMDMGHAPVWDALDAALAAGGITAELCAIHCAMAGYAEYARLAGVDPDAAIQRWAGRAAAPNCGTRRIGHAPSPLAVRGVMDWRYGSGPAPVPRLARRDVGVA